MARKRDLAVGDRVLVVVYPGVRQRGTVVSLGTRKAAVRLESYPGEEARTREFGYAQISIPEHEARRSREARERSVRGQRRAQEALGEAHEHSMSRAGRAESRKNLERAAIRNAMRRDK